MHPFQHVYPPMKFVTSYSMNMHNSLQSPGHIRIYVQVDQMAHAACISNLAAPTNIFLKTAAFIPRRPRGAGWSPSPQDGVLAIALASGVACDRAEIWHD